MTIVGHICMHFLKIESDNILVNISIVHQAIAIRREHVFEINKKEHVLITDMISV